MTEHPINIYTSLAVLYIYISFIHLEFIYLYCVSYYQHYKLRDQLWITFYSNL